MQTIIELIPLKGVKASTKTIDFGAEKKQVLREFGLPEEETLETLYLDDYELAVSFDQEGRVNFIECLYGSKSEKTTVMLEGCPLFQTPATDVIERLTELNQGAAKEDEELGHVFEALSLACYRPSTPAEIQEEIDLMKQGGSYEEHREWLEEDLALANYFQTLGLGAAGYYDNQ